MEMEGRGLSDLFRNTSEEIFLKAMMENSMGVATAPRIGDDFYEAINEVNSEFLHKLELLSLSSEAAGLPNQQHDIAQQNFLTDNLVPHNSAIPPVEYPNNHNQQSLKNAAEKGMQASDILLAKTPKFVSPSSSSTSPLDNPHVMAQDTVTSVVSMLKDTLERKKLGSHANNDASAGNSFGFYDTQQFQQNILGGTDIFPLVSTSQVQDSPMLSRVERPMEPNHGNFIAPANQVWFGAPSREPSHSGSSTAMTAHSAGFEVCDELPSMGHAMSVCESTRKNASNGTTDCRSKGKEYRERVLKDNVKDDRKKAALTRMGSVTSEQADNGDPTKKRRVERSRKMAEAKERSSTPVIPSDMQAVLKRCENLEKEVRSLKLNLSFMNRKDSEQTKQIEELQKQNEELTEEKERLLEEIERIV
nr:unnamed protein product [Digitaria exilis]